MVIYRERGSKNHKVMEDFQAFVVITLLIWAAVSVFGTTTELSTTAGDTVNIACLFGEGTPINIYWYYNNGIERQKLLFLAKGNISLGEEYANRASLQDDNLTLILENITVVDVGTYCCDVDRQGQIPVQNINTKLNVFSLRPDTLPVITPCTGNDESSSCSIHANQSFTLTCTLPNVYPVQDTELIWFQDGQRVSSTHDVMQNDDGTTDISRQIQVSETGNFTCDATYLSANGSENTAVSAEAWIKPPADVTNTTDKNLTKGAIVGIAMGTVTVLIVGIILCIYCWKTRTQCCSTKDEQNSEEVQPDQAQCCSTKDEQNSEEVQPDQEDCGLLDTSAENGSKEGNESSEPTERPEPAANRSTHEEVDISNPPPPSTVTPDGNVNRSDKKRVSDEEIIKLSELAPGENYLALCVALGFDLAFSKNILTENRSNYSAAFRDILVKWSLQTDRYIEDLDNALVKAKLGGLRDQYKM